MEFWAYLLTLITTILVFYVTGTVLSKLLIKGVDHIKPFQAVFLRVFLGVIIWVFGYSVIKSGGHTYNLALIPLLIFAWFEFKSLKPAVVVEGKRAGWFPSIPAIAAMMLASVFFVLYKYLAVHTSADFPWIPSHGADYVQHSLISQALQLIGAENKFAPESVMDKHFAALYPYHYFDLWLNALISQCSGLINMLTLELVTYPFFMVLSYLGILALVETQRSVKWWVVVVALLFVGFGSIHFDFYDGFHYLSRTNYNLNHFGEDALKMPKLLQYLPFALAFTILLIRQFYKLAFIVLIALSLVYFSAMVLFGVTGLFVFVNLLKPVWVSRKNAILIALYASIALAVFLGVHLLLSAGLEGTRDSFDLKLTDMSYAKTRVNIMGLSTIQAGIMYMPLLLGIVLILLGNYRKQVLDKQLMLLLLLAASVYALGLISWVIAMENIDGMQLVGNNMPVANMLLLGAFVVIFDRSYRLQPKKWNIVLGGLLFVGTSVFITTNDLYKAVTAKETAKKYGDGYVTQISKLFQDQNLLIGAFLKGDEEYTDPKYAPAHKISQSFRLSTFLVFMPQYYSTVPLSVFDIPFSDAKKKPIENKREVQAVEGSIFYRFVQQQKKQGTFSSIDQSQLDFISAYKIRYVIASRSARVSDLLQQQVAQTIVDSQTGERFLVLKTQ